MACGLVCLSRSNRARHNPKGERSYFKVKVGATCALAYMLIYDLRFRTQNTPAYLGVLTNLHTTKGKAPNRSVRQCRGSHLHVYRSLATVADDIGNRYGAVLVHLNHAGVSSLFVDTWPLPLGNLHQLVNRECRDHRIQGGRVVTGMREKFLVSQPLGVRCGMFFAGGSRRALRHTGEGLPDMGPLLLVSPHYKTVCPLAARAACLPS